MVDPQESRFWMAALQSELIDADGLKACLEAIPPEKRVGDTLQLDRRLARQAVHAGVLTLWQAQQLLAGRSTGFKINRYTLLDLIGQGGMGRVYLAKDTRLNRRVALKILSPERVNNPRAIARFQREARVGAQLQHENLVRIYDEGEANGKCYLVMEFIDGKNIGTMIADNGPMAPGLAATLVRQVALGLEHAQQKGLIHRDVNPYNILVTNDGGVAKLTDLGLAIDLAEQAPVTRDGATVGTFDYVSPEQARHSHSVDTRSDIYSLGCTLYHMLAGRVPFPSPSLPEKLFGHQALEPDALAGLVPGIPEGLVEVVRKMMRKTPEERFQTPKEVAQALEPFVDGLELGSSSSRDDASPARPVSPVAETRVIRAVEPSPPPAPAPAPAPGLDLGINFGGQPAQPAEAGIDLGIALDLGGQQTPAAPAAKAPAPPTPPAAPASPAPAPAKSAPPKPAPPAPPEPGPTPDFAFGVGAAEPAAEGGINLGLNLNLEEPAAAPPAPAKKPAAAPPPAPAAAPAAAASTKAPAPAKPGPPSEPPAPDFTFGLGAEEPAAEGGINLGLNLNADTPPTPAPAAAKKPSPAPVPKAPSPTKPTPAPAAAESPAPDFALSLGGEPPAAEGLNLGLNLNLDSPASAPAPQAKAAPAAKPASPPKAAPAPAPAAKPAPAEPPAAVPDFALSIGSEPASEGALNLGLNLNAPSAPAPTAPPKPAAKAAPAKSAPAASPEPVPAFALNLSGETPSEPALGFGLGLDLGPAPSIAPAKPAAPKPATPKPAATPPPQAAVDGEDDDEEEEARPKKARKLDRRVLIGAGIGSLLMIGVVGAVIATSVLGGKPDQTASKVKKGKSGKPPKAVVKTKPKAEKPDESETSAVASAEPTKPRKSIFDRPLPAGQGFAVVTGNGDVSREPTLKSAMQRAIGSKGRVVLSNKEPLKLTAEGDGMINISGGQLTVSAQKGTHPVLEVEIKGGNPWLMTRAETPLTLSGVTIVAKYAGNPGPNPPPVIFAGSDVTLDHCTFRTSGAVAGSCAVSVESNMLMAKGCFFENFDRALDFSAFVGSGATIRQCMMVRPKAGGPPIGWALRVRNLPGGQQRGKQPRPRSVVIDRCTTKGRGFLELADFSSEFPCEVQVRDCAVLADSLLSWEHAGGDAPPSPEALHWKGEGNKYDIQGKAWVVLKPDGSTPLADGPTDLGSWTQRFTERSAAGGPVKFQTEVAELPAENSAPVDFAIPEQGDVKVGADPAYVGPEGKPVR